MKIFKTAFISTLLFVIGCIAQDGAWAQTPPQNLSTGKTKIAVINTGALQDGIGEFKAKLENLNKQFEPRVKDVQALAEKINALETTINTQKDLLGPEKVAVLTEQDEALKKEYKRKSEDLQSDGQKTSQIALAPVRQRIDKFLAEYTAKRGITLIISLESAMESNILLWFDTRLDVTQDFIIEYNKANPVQSSATPGATTPK